MCYQKLTLNWGKLVKIKELYENIIVMLYTIILAITTVVVVLYSRDIYSKVNIDNAMTEDIEVATSYLNVKIRQNDKSNTVDVKNIESLNQPALFISKTENDIWIYQYNENLVQEDTPKGEMPQQKNYFEIAEISDFNISKVDKRIEYSLAVEDIYEETMAISLRSDN